MSLIGPGVSEEVFEIVDRKTKAGIFGILLHGWASVELPRNRVNVNLFLRPGVSEEVFEIVDRKTKAGIFGILLHGWASVELPRNRVNVNLFLRHIRDLSR